MNNIQYRPAVEFLIISYELIIISFLNKIIKIPVDFKCKENNQRF